MGVKAVMGNVVQAEAWNGTPMNAEAAAEVFGADDVYPMSEVRETAEPQEAIRSIKCQQALQQTARPSSTERARLHNCPADVHLSVVLPVAMKAPRDFLQRGQPSDIKPWESVGERGCGVSVAVGLITNN
jgi:hypothetical protein